MEDENTHKCPYGGFCTWDDGRVCEQCPKYMRFWYDDNLDDDDAAYGGE